MNTHRWLVFSGVLIVTLLLSGCMAAMMPAMMLGHAAHKKANGTPGQTMKSCECEKPAAPSEPVATAPDSAGAEKGVPPPAASHKH